MDKHTKEPWILVEGGACEKEMLITTDDRHECCVIPIAEMDVIFDGEFGDEQSANARRIVACVNACHGLPTDELEQKGLVAAVGTKLLEADQQRDELLVVVEKVFFELESLDASGDVGGWIFDEVELLRSAIAKAKGGAA